MKSLVASSIGEIWQKCIKLVLDEGTWTYDEDVRIKEILGISVYVENPNISDSIIERFGDHSVIDHTFKKFERGVVMNDRPFTYAECIYNKNGVDQFQWLVDRLKSKKESKSATISLLTEGKNDINLPCLNIIDAKIRDNCLIFQFFYRSQNIFGRQYANLLALAKLQHDLAQKLDVGIGFLSGYVASAHIYEYDINTAVAVCSNKDIKIKDNFYQRGPKSIRKSYWKN